MKKPVVATLKPASVPVGITNKDQIDIWNAFEESKLLSLRKNNDYGSSVFTRGPLTQDIPVEDAIRVRIGDKLNRLSNLLSNPNRKTIDESVQDTWLDLSAYCILAYIINKRGTDEKNSSGK